MGQWHRWIGRLRPVLATAALVLVLGGVLWAARPPAKKELAPPSYVIPNIVAVVMCMAALAVPCKRFRRV